MEFFTGEVPTPSQVTDHVSANIIVNQLRGQVAELITKHGNNEAAMFVVLSKWSRDVGSLQVTVDNMLSQEGISKENRDILTEKFAELTMSFTGIKAIGISDLHAHIMPNVPSGTTPQCIAADPSNNLVEPAVFHQVNAMTDGSVSLPSVDSRVAGELEDARREAEKAEEITTKEPSKVEPYIGRRRKP